MNGPGRYERLSCGGSSSEEFRQHPRSLFGARGVASSFAANRRLDIAQVPRDTVGLLEDLVTGAEAARRLGVSRQRIGQLARTEGFPRPLGKVGQAVVWRWTEIEAWAAEHRPTPQQSRHASEPQE